MCRTLPSRPSDLRIYVGDMSSTKPKAMAGWVSGRVDPRVWRTRQIGPLCSAGPFWVVNAEVPSRAGSGARYSALGSGAPVLLKSERGTDYVRNQPRLLSAPAERSVAP